MSDPFFNNVERYPVSITKGSRTAKVYDEIEDCWMLDFWGDEATQGLGYDIGDLLREFADTGIPHQLPEIYPNPVRTAFAERLCGVYGYDKVFFSNSGAEANETAIKLARKYAWAVGKRGAVCYTLTGNFHGRTLGALGLSDSLGSGSPYHKSAYHWAGPDILQWEGFGVLPDSIESIRSMVDPEETAAIFLAPILGNNCVKVYHRSFLQALREYCTLNDILLVYDEVQSASGWTGYYSAAEYYGVQPDIMNIGKRIALGFPMTATLTTDELARMIGVGTHFNTFAGSPFVCWMAGKWLDWLENGGLEEVRAKGNYIEEQLRKYIPKHLLKSVNRAGMMCSFALDYRHVSWSGFDLAERARARGLLIVSHREYGETRFTPPLTVTYDEIDAAVAALEAAISDLSRDALRVVSA